MTVRLIGPDGAQLGIVLLAEAQKQAAELELDLVEIAPEAKPPVYKILDKARDRGVSDEVLGDPIFRDRQVPRMLHLATARADGDTSVPDELANYAARSKQGKAARGQST